jgi:Acetyltransferase (GNAT) domain
VPGQPLRSDANQAVVPRLVDGTPHANSIFQQPWWLDAVAPGSWGEVTVERGGETVARLPYVMRRRGTLRVLTQPPWTQTLGPWVAKEPGAKAAKAVGDELELLAALEATLPRAHAFRQSFSPTMLNALPFFWAGYRLEIRYTYRLEGLASESALWDGLSGNIRREIRKARTRLEIREDLGIDRFHETWAKTFERQGLRVPEIGQLARLEAACASRDARAMLFATDEADRVHAVAYVVWDRHAAYYLLGGGDPELRTSGASSLLMWEAITRARRQTEVFDFEGSMLKPVERFFRAFGGRQTPYLHVSRTSRTAQAAFALHDGLGRLTARRR